MNIAMEWDIPDIKEEVAIKDDKDRFVYKLICEDNTEYLLKTKNNVQQIDAEAELLTYLADNSIPIAVPLRTRDNRLFATYLDNNYVLYKFINGNHIRCESFDEYAEAARVYGSVLAKFHKVIKNYVGNIEYIKDMNLHNQIFTWALPIIEKQQRYAKIRDIVFEIKDDLSEVFIDLPKQFIHRDFHEDNILFDGKRLIGIIDFDSCMIGYKVYDICYILTSILLNDLDSIEFKANWIKLIPILLNSYLKENELEDCEISSLWYIFLASQLTFIAWAITQDNEKLLNDNLQGFYWIYENRNEIIGQIETFK
ncbi:MAG: phosphotransferase [Clostridiales bacterium]|nr:phosphotransferase [Clostridiales bacterium]